MKYKVGDRIKLLCDTWRIYKLIYYSLEKGKTYTINDVEKDNLYNLHYELNVKNGEKFNSLFIEDEKCFKPINRKLKLERILKN